MADPHPDELDAQIAQFGLYLRTERRASPHTQAAYLRDLEFFRAYLREQALPLDARKLELLHLRSFLAALFPDHEPATIARKIASLRAFFRYLVQRRICSANPAARLRLPKVPKP